MRGVVGTEGIQKSMQSYGAESYNIVKTINGKKRRLGHGTTLIIALMKLDWCKANGWKPYPKSDMMYINKTRAGTYNIKKQYLVDGKIKTVNYGNFSSLEDAQSERDKLVSVDWDIDAWCDLG